MIDANRSFEHRGYATRRTHLMPVRPLQVVRKATVSDWLSGFFCVAGIIAIVTAWGLTA